VVEYSCLAPRCRRRRSAESHPPDRGTGRISAWEFLYYPLCFPASLLVVPNLLQLKKVLMPLIAVSVSLLVAILLIELGCRFWFSRHLDYQVEMSRYAAALKSTSSVFEMGHEHRPSTQATLMGVPVTISSAGFRDREYEKQKPSGTYRILLLGDSLTFGWGVRAEARFSAILEARLAVALGENGPYERSEVINTGIGNYNTSQQVGLFGDRGRSWQPDLVVLNHFINDAEPSPRKTAPAIFRHSYLGMLLWGRFDISGQHPHPAFAFRQPSSAVAPSRGNRVGP